MSIDLVRNFGYHVPTKESEAMHTEARKKIVELAEFLEKLLPDSREKSLAFTSLEQVSFWTNASIARTFSYDSGISTNPTKRFKVVIEILHTNHRESAILEIKYPYSEKEVVEAVSHIMYEVNEISKEIKFNLISFKLMD